MEREIKRSIANLQRNSIINLVLGVVGSAVTIFILIATLKGFNKNYEDFIMFFVPRATFAVFLQLLTFFFLRLYRNNLRDVKYFQNELTNINAKISAIELAHFLGKDERLEEMLSELFKVERNFTIKQGETMRSLELAKLDQKNDSEMLEVLKGVSAKLDAMSGGK